MRQSHDASIPVRVLRRYDDQIAALATASGDLASIDQAIGVLAWRHAVTTNQAGALLEVLAGASRQLVVHTARVLVRDAEAPLCPDRW